MKNPGIIALALVAILAVAVDAQSHTVTWGSQGPKDTLAFREIVEVKSKFLQVVTADRSYPPKGQGNTRNITCIRATDQYINGNGGYATLSEGGVGFKNVSLHFKSQRGHGINFIVEVYVE